jgi:Holliday junction resolvase RusA-like endonuclease
MTEQKIVVPGNPVSVNRAYRTGQGNFYMDGKTSAWKDLVGWQAKAQWRGPAAAGRVKVRLDLFFKGNQRRDLDNCAKPILDALEGITFENDSQVDELHLVRRRDDVKPCVEITITQL